MFGACSKLKLYDMEHITETYRMKWNVYEKRNMGETLGIIFHAYLLTSPIVRALSVISDNTAN